MLVWLMVESQQCEINDNSVAIVIFATSKNLIVKELNVLTLKHL